MTNSKQSLSVEELARALAKADGAARGNRYALNAYNAGVGMAIDYWNTLAKAVLHARTTGGQ